MAYERGYAEEDTVAFYEVLREMGGSASRGSSTPPKARLSGQSGQMREVAGKCYAFEFFLAFI